MADVTLVYIYPMLGDLHDRYAARFVSTYHEHLPGMRHKLLVVANGGPPTPLARLLFSSIACEFIEHDDSGWDIGGFQKAVEHIDTELAVFCGGTVSFERDGWLKRMHDAYVTHGRRLYGTFACWQPALHIRTTGFWMPTELFAKYPFRITDTSQRYGFEWGPNNMTEWLVRSQLEPVLVTWSGDYFRDRWSRATGFYGTGVPGDCLLRDRQCNTTGYIET